MGSTKEGTHKIELQTNLREAYHYKLKESPNSLHSVLSFVLNSLKETTYASSVSCIVEHNLGRNFEARSCKKCHQFYLSLLVLKSLPDL